MLGTLEDNTVTLVLASNSHVAS